MGEVPSQDLFVSVLTIGEIERGIERQRQLDPEFAERIASWLDMILRTYESRILVVDVAVARRWGRLSYLIGNKGIDLAISATALEHGLTVATRSLRFRADGRTSLQSFQPAVGSEAVSKGSGEHQFFRRPLRAFSMVPCKAISILSANPITRFALGRGRRVVIGFIRLLDYFDGLGRPPFSSMNSTPAVTEGDCEKHFGFATLGSFRKTRGTPTSVCVFRLAHARGPTLGGPVR